MPVGTGTGHLRAIVNGCRHVTEQAPEDQEEAAREFLKVLRPYNTLALNITEMTEEGERKRGGDPFWAELRDIQERHKKSCPGGRNAIDRAAFVLMDNA